MFSLRRAAITLSLVFSFHHDFRDAFHWILTFRQPMPPRRHYFHFSDAPLFSPRRHYFHAADISFRHAISYFRCHYCWCWWYCHTPFYAIFAISPRCRHFAFFASLRHYYIERHFRHIFFVTPLRCRLLLCHLLLFTPPMPIIAMPAPCRRCRCRRRRHIFAICRCRHAIMPPAAPFRCRYAMISSPFHYAADAAAIALFRQIAITPSFSAVFISLAYFIFAIFAISPFLRWLPRFQAPFSISHFAGLFSISHWY